MICISGSCCVCAGNEWVNEGSVDYDMVYHSQGLIPWYPLLMVASLQLTHDAYHMLPLIAISKATADAETLGTNPDILPLLLLGLPVDMPACVCINDFHTNTQRHAQLPTHTWEMPKMIGTRPFMSMHQSYSKAWWVHSKQQSTLSIQANLQNLGSAKSVQVNQSLICVSNSLNGNSYKRFCLK